MLVDDMKGGGMSKPKRFKVTWSEHYDCEKVVEAKNKDEAVDLCYYLDGSQLDKRELDRTSDWEVLEV